ncbi:MAG: DNA-processing protein DprA [Acidobacteriota bacterium]
MDESEETQARAAVEISLTPGVGTQAQDRLWKANPRLPDLFNMSSRELASFGLPAEAAAAISSGRYRAMAEEIIDWARREKCRLLVRGGSGYPAILNEIYDPPLILYCRGQVEVLDLPGLAIVGTRRPTFYGLQMAQGLAFDLGKRDLVIVSGLARGVDAAAHRGCLEAKGRTVAVLGCGIDVVYPREHRQLTQMIVESGTLLSEFPPGTSPAPQNFPVRNRIISGMSLGTVIVEASEYSGSLITARLAMEQNREVFAVPGNLTSPQSFGPNYLIKQGAKLVQIWRDIVEELPAEVRHKILAREDTRPRQAPELDLATADESNILGLLAYDQATQFDRILQKSGMSVPQLSELLLNLEMRGRIRQVPGNLFVRVVRHEE